MTVFVLILTKLGIDSGEMSIDGGHKEFLDTNCIGVFKSVGAVEKAVREGLPQYEWKANPRLALTWQADVGPRDDSGVSFVSAKAEKWEVQS